jgi:hypothetical protein
MYCCVLDGNRIYHNFFYNFYTDYIYMYIYIFNTGILLSFMYCVLDGNKIII